MRDAVRFAAGRFAGVAPLFVAVAAGLVVLAVALLASRAYVSRAVVTVLAPVVARVSALYREDPHGRRTVAEAVERFWSSGR